MSAVIRAVDSDASLVAWTCCLLCPQDLKLGATTCCAPHTSKPAPSIKKTGQSARSVHRVGSKAAEIMDDSMEYGRRSTSRRRRATVRADP